MISILMTLVGDDPKEQARFRRLYDNYSMHLYLRAFGYLRSEQDALDAVQDAFMRVAVNFDKIGDVDSKQTKHYLLTIVDNVAKSQLMRNRKRREAEEAFIEIQIHEQTTEISIISDVYSETEMLDAITKLPATYKEVLYLRYLDGMNASEIAETLSITKTASRKRIERAKDALADIINIDNK